MQAKLEKCNVSAASSQGPHRTPVSASRMSLVGKGGGGEIRREREGGTKQQLRKGRPGRNGKRRDLEKERRKKVEAKECWARGKEGRKGGGGHRGNAHNSAHNTKAVPG